MKNKQKWQLLDDEFYFLFHEHVFTFIKTDFIIFGELVFDIFKFEKFMENKGYNPYENISLAKFVEKKYGNKGYKIIIELLK